MRTHLGKWYFALDADSPREYEEMCQAAVISALLNTSLQPVLLYNGKDNPFTDWLEGIGASVVRLSGRFDDLFREAEAVSNGLFDARCARGSFLRFEIPEREHEDEYVLYTDVDVLFLADPSPVDAAPPLFACAPERSLNVNSRVNAGVMVMNVRAMRKELPAIEDYVREVVYSSEFSDQAVLNALYCDECTPLPPVYNWKPYWGLNPGAIILHYHGPKPADIAALIHADHDPSDRFHRLMRGNKASYMQYLMLYQEFARHAAAKA